MAKMTRYTKYERGGTGLGVTDLDPNPQGDYYAYVYADWALKEAADGFKEPYPSSYYTATMFESDNFQFEYKG